MLSTWLVSSAFGATVIVSATGACWALTAWAPFALLAVLLDEVGHAGEAESVALAPTKASLQIRHSTDEPDTPARDSEDDDDLELSATADADSISDRAGVYLGLMVRPDSARAR